MLFVIVFILIDVIGVSMTMFGRIDRRKHIWSSDSLKIKNQTDKLYKYEKVRRTETISEWADPYRGHKLL